MYKRCGSRKIVYAFFHDNNSDIEYNFRESVSRFKSVLWLRLNFREIVLYKGQHRMLNASSIINNQCLRQKVLAAIRECRRCVDSNAYGVYPIEEAHTISSMLCTHFQLQRLSGNTQELISQAFSGRLGNNQHGTVNGQRDSDDDDNANTALSLLESSYELLVDHNVRNRQRLQQAEEVHESNTIPSCVICMRNPARTVAVPCGHYLFCLSHAEITSRLASNWNQKCPVCRMDLDRVICVYA